MRRFLNRSPALAEIVLSLAVVVGALACSDDGPKGRCEALDVFVEVTQVLSDDDNLTEKQCLEFCDEPRYSDCRWTPSMLRRGPGVPSEP
ncbi:MAG: hypothetical protein GTN62_08340 [Gemmatimonadales bacterium]|nr:hypothetical protein [Gemmatimonadales bacterium]NIN50109.1 hypothetical protein [Gemmatimonadales bacterium]NIP07573.1 hypothetical protein [Gemmatimonadales bacterium]NIR01729.1 hypothetical protein [Gemmatimonadales bacterium]NIS65632.1 hypothetical protein [Gemmatimonadales bacterium]